MKNFKAHLYIFLTGCMLILCFQSCRTDQWVVPSVYLGEWETEMTEIIVRSKIDNQHSQFTRDSAIVHIRINSDKSVHGSIGNATLSNGRIIQTTKIPLLREGFQYYIRADLTERIFPKDPLEIKTVDIWLWSIYKNGNIKAGLRPSGLNFPMADLLLKKITN